MANEEHLAILKQGVETWNQWREENPEIRPELRNSYLSGANLSGADLSRAYLDRANLIGTDLSGADLRHTDLIGTHLSGANLSRADLIGANLSRADLSRANLHEADLTDVYLREADLCGADLHLADLRYADLIDADLNEAEFAHATVGLTSFGGANLSQVKGLDTVVHAGPSTIGIDTIYRSQGKIPESFLRGAGIPDDFIAYIDSFIAGKSIQFYSCFISYSDHDRPFAERLYAGLQNKGVRCWYAPEDMKIGSKIRQTIDEAIRLRDKLLVVLSEHSLASSWVEDEVEAAFEEEKRRQQTVLFPVRLDDAVMESNKGWASKLRQRHIGDFRQWKYHDTYESAFERLLRDLKSEAKKGG